MRTVTRVLIAAALAFGVGCVSTDWIDRTLVTVDVTGTWEGSVKGYRLVLDLKQEGPRVTGFGYFYMDRGGPLEGTLAGDTFRFKPVSTGSLQGEMTVNGDEMNGRVETMWAGSDLTSLRRVTRPSPPGPQNR